MRLVRIDASNWREAILLRPKRQQYKYIRREAVLYALAKTCVSRPGEYAPYVIEHDGRMVGAILVRNYGHGIGFAAFFIDRRHQGKGLGRMTLEHLLQWARKAYPSAREIETAVEPTNAPARRLYESLGFHYTGVVNPNGVLDMEMPLPA